MPISYAAPANIGQNKLSKSFKNDKPFLIVTGKVGTGKTLLTVSESLQAVFEEKRFGKNGQIVYTRLQESLGKELGFLPGGLKDGKSAEFMKPFTKSLKIMNAMYYMEQYNEKRIFLDAIQTMRGDTYHDTVMIVDEVQNLDKYTLLGVATRPDLNSKTILLGNFSQIDNPKLRKPENNGLFVLLNGLYEQGHHNLFDHVHLTEGKRNKHSTIIEQILNPDNEIDKRMIDLELKGAV